jgi:hypothetical protein
MRNSSWWDPVITDLPWSPVSCLRSVRLHDYSQANCGVPL